MSAKRPKVPRALVGLFWRVKVWHVAYVGERHYEYQTKWEARNEWRNRDSSYRIELYRVTVWRKKG